MIKERVDKDYHSMLRTALTSISKVNKTDVETLRTSFGVCFLSMYFHTLGDNEHIPGRALPPSQRHLPSNFRISPASAKSKQNAYKTRSTSLSATTAPVRYPLARNYNFVPVNSLLVIPALTKANSVKANLPDELLPRTVRMKTVPSRPSSRPRVRRDRLQRRGLVFRVNQARCGISNST